MKKPLQRLLAGLTLTAAALFVPTVVNDILSPQDDTAWGAPATVDDTGWGSLPADLPVNPPVDLPVIPLDTAWG